AAERKSGLQVVLGRQLDRVVGRERGIVEVALYAVGGRESKQPEDRGRIDPAPIRIELHRHTADRAIQVTGRLQGARLPEAGAAASKPLVGQYLLQGTLGNRLVGVNVGVEGERGSFEQCDLCRSPTRQVIAVCLQQRF